MYSKLVYLIFTVLLVAGSITAHAEVFSDNFDTSRDYLTEGVEGTGWDGFIGLGEGEIITVLDSSISRPGSLYIESESPSYWESPFDPLGPLLYKLVEGDFIATVQVTDFPGLPGSDVIYHNDSFLMARVPDLADAGDGEDFVCVGYFPTWSGNNRRSIDDDEEDEDGSTGDGFDCDTYIQLERIGNDFHFRTSSNGAVWTNMVGSPVTRDDMSGLAVQVGLGQCTYGGSGNGYVAFDNFSLEGPNVFPPNQAVSPSPADKQEDILRDCVLSWVPATSAVSHDVYIGTSLEDVTIADKDSPLLVSPAQAADTYDAGRLEFGQTYYWRIDEIEADGTTRTGLIWSFTVEPLAYPISGENITATASSQSEGQGPENTINNSGMDTDDLHSTSLVDMWISQSSEPGEVWIQYDFDKMYKLNEMLVWNYNGQSISSLFGFEAVTVEYSPDGSEWKTLENISAFSQASGLEGYAANTTVDFNNVAAKSVKIIALNNFGGGSSFFNQYGLSEVRFMYIPVSAREPDPESGAIDVALETTLSWKPGREVSEHNIYLSSERQAVTDGTATVTTVNQTDYSPAALNIGSTYYWRVDEVNNAEATALWQGTIWNFSTQEYLVVDNFESYNDIAEGQEGSNLVYLTWVDGYENPSVNGSTMGYVSGSSLDTDITIEGSGHSVPLSYDNSVAGVSKVSADPGELAVGRNWTTGSPQVLVLNIFGDVANNASTDQLYVSLNGTKVFYEGSISRPVWEQWEIDIASLGIDLSNVNDLTVGIQGSGSGMLYLDDILLYRVAPATSSEEIWIEAEDADSITAPMYVYDDPNASGGKYISKDEDSDESTSSPPSDGIAKYTFNIEKGGTYKIFGRVITSGSNDSFWVRLDGAATNTQNHSSGWIQWSSMTQEDVWGWEEVVSSDDDYETVLFTMEPGTYTFEVTYREDESWLDAILIQKID